MVGETTSDDKRRLRQQLLAARPALFAAPLAAHAPEQIRDAFLEAIGPPPGAVVSVFWPMAGELDTRPLLHALHARGCVCALPVVVRSRTPLVFRTWTPQTALMTSSFGIAEPGDNSPVVVPDISAVPFLAFDRDGYRLGYGGGFYDRTLAALRDSNLATLRDGASAKLRREVTARPFVAVGVGLSSQRVDILPREAFDQRLDCVVTEAGAVLVAPVR